MDKVTLDTIKGYKEEKKEIKNIVKLLNHYDEYSKKGVNIPRGLIFQGPPGTGKTLFARAIANECNYNFFEAFDKNLQENTLDTLKKTFRKAESYSKTHSSPALIYIDEIDKLVFTNVYGELVDDKAREATRYLLQKLDETNFKNKILIIASTNSYGRLPDALLRSGRFDKKFLIDLPDVESRRDILSFYMGDHPLFKNINVTTLALRTGGMSGADLKTLINNTLIEYITIKDKIELNDFLKIINEMNFETIGKRWKDSRNALEVLSHECGHLLVAYELNGRKNWGNISALKYGNIQGHTDLKNTLETLEEETNYDEDYTSYKDLINSIIINFGGAAGEKIFYNNISTGLLGDLESTRICLSILFRNGAFGFKYSDAYYDGHNPDFLSDRIYKKHLSLVKKYYKIAYKIIKRNKILGLYIIDETHKNEDALSGDKIEEKVNYFYQHKKEMIKKYKRLKLKDLANENN